MKALLDWLEDRTGYREFVDDLLYENVPGGARWRYVWGSTLVFTFVVQVITGTFLWMAYSPSAQTAWESVHYIQHDMQGGYLVRGLHHFTAQAMIVLLALHLLQVVVDGAYRAPREINFWLGLVLIRLLATCSLGTRRVIGPLRLRPRSWALRPLWAPTCSGSSSAARSTDITR
jgi:ubiquinol-cytochrome c reductase cytochrome b subunit